jgi:hypothetical protein
MIRRRLCQRSTGGAGRGRSRSQREVWTQPLPATSGSPPVAPTTSAPSATFGLIPHGSSPTRGREHGVNADASALLRV